jgi:hypothetical protein
MGSNQERSAAVTDSTTKLIAQLRELDRLREKIRKAQLSAQRYRRIDHRKRTHI